MNAHRRDFKRFSILGLDIPYQSMRVRGAMRTHSHTYPHTPGAAIEKLGREPYEITAQVMFHSSHSDPAFADLWPTRLNLLMAFFDSGESTDVHLPSIGTIKAVATEWERELSTQVLNGEATTIKLLEDPSEAFLVFNVLTAPRNDVADKAARLQLEADTIDPKPSIFDQINDAANAVFAVIDQVDMYGNLVEAKILGLKSLIEQADNTVDRLNDPLNHTVLSALQELWEATQALLFDVQSKGFKMYDWTVSRVMSVTEAAVAIYGDASRAVDLLQLNGLPDPYAISAGTVLRYYP